MISGTLKSSGPASKNDLVKKSAIAGRAKDLESKLNVGATTNSVPKPPPLQNKPQPTTPVAVNGPRKSVVEDDEV